MDPIWGYQAINVEAQQSDQSSLLHWTRNMIALRKLFQVFGRGTQEFLNPDNRKILAYLRQYEEDGNSETVLCVANLSRFAQPVSLDLARFAGMDPGRDARLRHLPIHHRRSLIRSRSRHTLSSGSNCNPPLNARGRADRFGRRRRTHPQPAHATASTASSPVPALSLLQELLPATCRTALVRRKVPHHLTVAVLDSAQLPGLNAVLVFLQITYDDDSTRTSTSSPTITTGDAAETIRASDPAASRHRHHRERPRHPPRRNRPRRCPSGPPHPHRSQRRSSLHANGTLIGRKSSAFAEARGTDPLPARTGSAEQSNTSILYGTKLILKLFRRLQPGENPDTEIGRFLTEVAHFPASLRSSATSRSQSKGRRANHRRHAAGPRRKRRRRLAVDPRRALPLLRRASPPARTARSRRSTAVRYPAEQPPKQAREHAGLSLDAAALLGRRTAEMHLALATPTDNPAFSPRTSPPPTSSPTPTASTPSSPCTLDALKRGMSQLPEATADTAALVLSRRIELFARAHAIASATPADAGQRIRIHGDYHLGQVLRSRSDYVILDFEGEPARSLAERRAKQSPLKDVAGMLRSFSYAAYAALNTFAQRRPDDAKNLEPWATLWQNAVSDEFLRAYQHTIAAINPDLIPQPAQAQLLLNAYLLEKSLYELLYELNNRPTWVRIPLGGILALLQ